MYKAANVLLAGLPWLFYKLAGKPTPTQKEKVENRIYDVYATVNIPTFAASEKEFKKGMELLFNNSSFRHTDDLDLIMGQVIELARRPFGFKMSLNSVGEAVAKKLEGNGSFHIQIYPDQPARVWFPERNFLAGPDMGWCHDCHDFGYTFGGSCDECGSVNLMPMEGITPTDVLVIDKAIAKGPSESGLSDSSTRTRRYIRASRAL